MASIRKFFERKKMDRKFKQAGPGHSLAEGPSQPHASTTRSPQQISQASQDYQRQRSSETAKAAEAALKRFESNKQDSSRPVSSKATWKHTTAFHVEETKQQMRAELGFSKIPEKPKEVNLEASPTLAVSGIYFRCPLCPVCLSELEIHDHLESCLLKDMNQEPAMTTSLMIRTLNAKQQGVDGCITILKKYLENIIKNPDEEKYRKIKKSNKVFKEKVAPLRGVSQFLTLGCGFVEEDIKIPDTDTTEPFYVLPEELAKDEEKLKLMIEFLEEAEPLKPTLNRSTRVFEPGATPGRFELPKEFYELSSSEIKKEQQMMTETVEKNKQLRTKAMREMDSGQSLRKYRFSVIRVRFPDGYLIQGTFYSHEPLSNVFHFVTECMNDSCPLFSLVSSTGHKLEDRSKSIESEGLSPAALLNFVPDPSIGNDDSQGYLLADLLARTEWLQ